MQSCIIISLNRIAGEDVKTKSMIFELEGHGLSQTQIANKSGINKATVSKLISGKASDVYYERGKQLEALHTHVCVKKQPFCTFEPEPIPAV